MKHGIFCLECDWWGTPHKRTTVEPMLELLCKTEDWEVPYRHRDVATYAEFEHHIRKWQLAKFDNFPILYLAFHGKDGELIVGEDERRADARVGTEWFKENLDVSGKNRMMYIASCGVLDAHGSTLNALLDATGLNAVCGYRCDIDWMRSTIFDLLILSQLCESPTITPGRIKERYEKVRRLAGPLADELGFRMVVRR